MVARALSRGGKPRRIAVHQDVWRGRAMHLHDPRVGVVRDFAGPLRGQLRVEIALSDQRCPCGQTSGNSRPRKGLVRNSTEL